MLGLKLNMLVKGAPVNTTSVTLPTFPLQRPSRVFYKVPLEIEDSEQQIVDDTSFKWGTYIPGYK